MQIVLLGSVLALAAAMAVRFTFYLRNQYAGLTYRYPTSWTAQQAEMFGRLRLAIGGCLTIAWLTLLLTAPRLPVSWPFGFEETLLTIGLLLLTNAWLVLLVRLNWENSLLSRCRFRTGFAIVTLWWITVFVTIFTAIRWATMPQLHLIFPLGTIV